MVGNIWLYSLEKTKKTWVVTWQAVSDSCRIHGICGANSLCTYDHFLGQTCTCLLGFKIKNPSDWIRGCETEFKISCSFSGQFHFSKLTNVDFMAMTKSTSKNLRYKNVKSNA